jgi:UPF0755 protein
MAHPTDPEVRPVNPYVRAGRYGRGPGRGPRYDRDGRGPLRGLLGLVTFLVFILVLAAIVLFALNAMARPMLAGLIVPWAEDNPGALRIGFVEDLVRDDIGPALTARAGGSAMPVEFSVELGDTPTTLSPRLLARGIIESERAFLFEARMQNLAAQLDAGRYLLRGNMTPAEVVRGLMENRIVIQTTTVRFREGLRLEQMTAQLQTISGLSIDPLEFYELAIDPPADLLGEYPWLTDPRVRLEGASLEGFLYPATYTVRIDELGPTDAEGLIRMMLDAFYQRVGPDRLDVAEERGLDFYEILTMASIVEREAVLDDERPTIAGVYQNRIDGKLDTRLLEADPTVFYGVDTVDLSEMDFDEWQTFAFWTPRGVKLNTVELPDELAGYQTYKRRGLPPGPICTPTVASIDAALDPETETDYLFFVAIPDGGGAHDFSKTYKQHLEKLKKYGYQ